MTYGLPESIASFVKPPLAEVVTSVRFAPMKPLSFLSLDALWQDQWSETYPETEIQAPYGAPVETFALPSPAPGNFEFQLPSTPPLPRLWFTSRSGVELLQVQRDWFAANWRRTISPNTEAQVPYDRWPARRAAFLRNWEVLSAWLTSRDESGAANQLEVTYINHIYPIEGVWSSHADANQLFSGLDVRPGPHAAPERFTYQGQFTVAAEDDLPQARLHVTATPAFAAGASEPSPIIVLELTARGAPPESSDLVRVLDRSRRVIVESFVQIMSDGARQAWGEE